MLQLDENITLIPSVVKDSLADSTKVDEFGQMVQKHDSITTAVADSLKNMNIFLVIDTSCQTIFQTTFLSSGV